MNPIGIISLKKYVSVSPQMVIAFFSAEKMPQNYNKYLTYANKLLFFSLNATFFAHKVYYSLVRLCEKRCKGTIKKQKAQRFDPLRPK